MDNLSNISKILLENENFSKSLEDNIKFIMKDGKVDIHDIPQIIKIVTECYNNLGKIKVTYEQLPEILKEITDYIFEKYNLVPENQKEKFTNMVDTIIDVVMLQPRIKKSCLKLKNFLCKK